MSTLFLMKGISATGKGTRISTLIEFLKTVDQEYQSWFVTKIGNTEVKKPYQIALHFPNVGITFMGRWVRSNKTGRMVSWSSLDAFSAFKENYVDIMKMANGSHYCMEGYFGGKGSWCEPPSIKEAGYDKLIVDHFLFKDLEELQQRCLGRSGARIKGSCYGDNVYFLDPNKKQKYMEYFQDLATKSDIALDYQFNMSDSPVFDWGCRVLVNIGRKDLKYAFLDYAAQNHTLRHTERAQENIDKFSKYLLGDTTNIKYVELPTVTIPKEDSNIDLPFENKEGMIKVNEATVD